MKTLVVFYSLDGSTKLTAEAIAGAVGADILELVPVKGKLSGGASRYFRGGRSAIMKDTPALEPYSTKPDEYELVFIGTPVWAWTCAPPLNTFLQNNHLKGKNVALFCCHGGGPGKIFKAMRKAVPGAVVMGELELREPVKHDTELQMEKARRWAEEICQTLS